MGGRISYSGFRAIFTAAWLLVAGALLCFGAHIRLGFVLLIGAGVPLAILGGMLALNSGELSDRMVEEVQSRRGNAPGALSVSRFGGTLLLIMGSGMSILGVLELVT